ncbi:MAG: TRAP transporter substrate-binding protein [Marinovum sp.]|nr:TRAP transporter substrate-binding protein [Marinovum sp.]
MNLTKTLALGAAASALMATGAMAQEVTLKLHQFLPAQANVPKLILDVWADKVEASSEGRIKIDRFPSMQLGGRPPELIDRAIDGVDDIVWTVVGYTPGRFPSTEVFELPFMVANPDDASCAYWTMFEEGMADTEFKDLEILGTWVHGPGVIHTADPVEEPADLEGMKIRGGSRLVNDLLSAAGATPVGMPAPAISESLSKGVIDGTTLPWEVAPALKIPELVENHTEFEGNALYTLTFVLAMNKAKYDALSDANKAAVVANSGMSFSVFATKVMQQEDARARARAIDDGNTIITISDTSGWQNIASSVYQSWIDDMAEKRLDGQAMIDRAQALMAGDCLGADSDY